MKRRSQFGFWLVALVACGDTVGHPPFRGVLADWSDSLARSFKLRCDAAPGVEDSLAGGGATVNVCNGLRADTLVAILLGEGDSVLAIRRVWGEPSNSQSGLPQLGSSFASFEPGCGGAFVAFSLDRSLVAIFRADSLGSNRYLTLLPERRYRSAPGC